MLNIVFKTSWSLILLMSLYIAGFTIIYFNFRPDVFFLNEKPPGLVSNLIWRTAFYIHISSSMICLAVGPFQFLKGLRRRNIDLHRNLGKIYLVCVLALGCPTGLYMAFFANGGFWTSLGFTLLSLAWWFCTWQAFVSVRSRKIVAHQKWMIRSFALSFSAVTLRMIWMPGLSILSSHMDYSNPLHLDHQEILHLTSFLNWIPNLLVAEWIIHRHLQRL